jgi:hypothetical protein
MNIDLNMITSNAAIAVPIVIAVVQAIKLTGWIEDHYAPLLAIGVGIVIGFFGNHENPDMTTTVLSGALYGLMSSGLYSGVKTTMLARMRMREKKQQQKYYNHHKDNH